MYERINSVAAAEELLKRRSTRRSLTAWARLKGFEPAKHHQLIIDEIESFLQSDAGLPRRGAKRPGSGSHQSHPAPSQRGQGSAWPLPVPVLPPFPWVAARCALRIVPVTLDRKIPVL
jgi:hypothetical protein